jgi:hypothetical protein
MDFVKIKWGGVEWMGLARDRYKWEAFVIAVMKFSGSMEGSETTERLHN